MYTAFLILILVISVSAQLKTPPKIEWGRSFGGVGADYAMSIQQTTDGGYIFGGFSYSSDGDVTENHGDEDYWVVKLNSTGSIEWQKSLGGSKSDMANSIQQTIDGGYIVAGTSLSLDGNVTGNKGSEDYWVVKLTSNGTIEWEKTFGGGGEDIAYSIQQTVGGGYIVAGSTRSIDGDVVNNQGGSDCWLLKLTNDGSIEWQKTLGGSLDDVAYFIQQTSDSGYIVSGASGSLNGDLEVTGNHGKFDCLVVKLTNKGIVEWLVALGGRNYDEASCIQQTTDEGFILGGYSGSIDGDVIGNHNDNNTYDFWIVKLTNEGTIDWQKSLGGLNFEKATSIQQTSDYGYIVSGYSASKDGDVTGNHWNNDYWIVKLSNTGSIEWQKSLGGTAEDFLFSAKQTTDGGYIVAGFSESNDGDVIAKDSLHKNGDVDCWIVKLSPEGTSSVESESATTRTATITPNPASSSATLTLDSDEAGACEVQIISVTGATLKEYSTRLTTGKQDIALTGLESLPSGMYEVLVKRSGHQTLRTKFIVQ